MWLIRTSTGGLEHFVGQGIPKYGILSHTWTNDKVSFNDMSLSSGNSKTGYRKITMTRQLAVQAGLQYGWVDTCCIDKSSSAELTEAINAMYHWYERSEVCFVYLEDLPAGADLDIDLQHCRWFTRGWTLQELVAPDTVHFYDRHWNFIGTKHDLIEHLTKITGIDKAVLRKEQSLSSIAVARKFSWAANRKTTRIEDTAYCLLGIFEINMPLLYGEETKAFRRLQTEIITTTPDLSIFAWRLPYTTGVSGESSRRLFSGLLAESPLAFSESSYNTVHYSYPSWDSQVTNIGIKTSVQLATEEISGTQRYRYILPLDCCGSSGKTIGVRLRKCGPDHFIRDDPFDLLERKKFAISGAPRAKYLLTRLPRMLASSDSSTGNDLASDFIIARSRSHVLQVRFPKVMDFYDAWPWSRYDDEDRLFFVQGDTQWDSASLRIDASFVLEHNGQPRAKVKLECMFFAIGWSRIERNALQCSIVESSPSANAISEVQSYLVRWDPDRVSVLETLKYHKVPRSTAAAIKIPGTDCSAVVSFKTTLVKDQDICTNEFWRVEFFCKTYETKNLPKTSHEKWSQSMADDEPSRTTIVLPRLDDQH